MDSQRVAGGPAEIQAKTPASSQVCPACGGELVMDFGTLVLSRVERRSQRVEMLFCGGCGWRMARYAPGRRQALELGLPETCGIGHRAAWQSPKQVAGRWDAECGWLREAQDRQGGRYYMVCRDRASTRVSPRGWAAGRGKGELHSSKAPVLLSLWELGRATASQIAAETGLSMGQTQGCLRRCSESTAPWVERKEHQPRGPHGYGSVWSLTQRGLDWVAWWREQNGRE